MKKFLVGPTLIEFSNSRMYMYQPEVDDGWAHMLTGFGESRDSLQSFSETYESNLTCFIKINSISAYMCYFALHNAFSHFSMVTYKLHNERTGFDFLNAQVSKKNGGIESIVDGKKHSLSLFDCCLVKLDAVVPIIHYHFYLQHEKIFNNRI